MDFLTNLDFAAIFKIIGIDIMLGLDNAIVIALACAALPAALRIKAVLWGTAGAIVLRALLLACAGFLMGLPFVKLIAGAYLLYLGYSLLLESGDEEHNVAPADRVWTAVKTVIVADFMMSLDNVLAVAGAAESAGEHSTLYAIAGIVLSIPIIVFGATALMGVMKRFPILIWLGGGLLGWVGAEMVIGDPSMDPVLAFLHESLGDQTHLAVKVVGFAAVIGAVLLAKAIKGGQSESATA